MMQVNDLVSAVKKGEIVFADVLAEIDSRYQHQPTAFRNGDVYNTAEQNQGSARVFAFAMLNGLGAGDTTSLFAEHYQSVLQDPQGTGHQNIRQFMIHGWEGINFEGQALVAR